MYSVKEAATKLGLDTSQVRRLLAEGKIKGKKLARDWVVVDTHGQSPWHYCYKLRLNWAYIHPRA